MPCRLGMLTTMRLWATCKGEGFRETVFSVVGLLGLMGIPFILVREEKPRLYLTVTIMIGE